MKYLALLFILFAGLSSYGQSEREDKLPEADPNFLKYLDDGLRSDANGNIQWQVSAMIPGFFELSYEHMITRSWSVEAGGGIKLFNGIDIVDRLNDIAFDSDLTGFGYSYTAGVRYYPVKGGITKYGYYGFDYKSRIRNYDESSISSNDFLFSTGRKAILKNNISIAVITSFGPRIYIQKFDDKKIDTEYYGGATYNIQFKLGYYINTKL